jgi:hypothetical protein
VMILINVLYLFYMFVMASVPELNCNTAYSVFRMQSFSVLKEAIRIEPAGFEGLDQ